MGKRYKRRVGLKDKLNSLSIKLRERQRFLDQLNSRHNLPDAADTAPSSIVQTVARFQIKIEKIRRKIKKKSRELLKAS